MGSIRMVMLDGLAVADLLALRQGGFFEGATVQLPGGASVTPVPVRVADAGPVVVPVVKAAPPAPVPAPVVDPEPVAEPAPPVAQDTRSEVGTGIDPTPVSVVAPEAPAAVPGAMPTIAQLAACTKLRDAIQMLLDGGLPAADLAGYLEMVKPEVPLLQRITNIGDRVARTLSVMGQGG